MSVFGRVAAYGSDGRDNGEAAAAGQPARSAFPKAFAGLTKAFAGLTKAFAGLTGHTNPARQGAESALQERLDLLIEFLERGLALDHLAVDEEGRCRIDLQHFAGELLIGGDLVEQRLVLEASLDRLLAEAGLLADPGQRFR